MRPSQAAGCKEQRAGSALKNERNDAASKNSFDDKKERYHNKRFTGRLQGTTLV